MKNYNTIFGNQISDKKLRGYCEKKMAQQKRFGKMKNARFSFCSVPFKLTHHLIPGP